ncbi:hypothetical protein SPHINGO391_490288 [Sphingomonas aurantiaca]|uniref:Uncharacterized protein n=1 Tax=Sphingomonas aurantiaca TaxID=185949 RepID=A0A5E8A7I3_9SPHN|nr:hypothetical protein SPHINGO391_490288 [Sphingomonas aurantiaca]
MVAIVRDIADRQMSGGYAPPPSGKTVATRTGNPSMLLVRPAHFASRSVPACAA